MADLSQMIRWQTGFVRGLAQSVLERARAIRSSLPPTPKVEAKTKSPAKKAVRKSTPKRAAAKSKSKAKKGKKTKGS